MTVILDLQYKETDAPVALQNLHSQKGQMNQKSKAGIPGDLAPRIEARK